MSSPPALGPAFVVHLPIVAVVRVGRTDSSTISVDKPSVFGGDPVVRVGDEGVLQK